jgi:N-acetylmuramoyl-L-alanine amidase
MMIRQFAALFLLSFSLTAISTGAAAQDRPSQKQALRKIIIDPGHGGTDMGASGVYSHEKDIALAISLKLDSMLREEMPDVETYLTRKTDIFDPVTVKAQIANREKGDLFVCIHVNEGGGPQRHREFIGYKEETRYKGKGKNRKAYKAKVKEYRTWTTPNTAKGTETFIYGSDVSNAAKEALSENEDMYLDSVSAKELKDFNPNDPAKMMIINMKLQSYFARSTNLALTIEDEFQKVGRISREAKQRKKRIWVLQAVAMPAVLVETGFISNPEEEDYLNSQEGQQQICEVIVRALKRYKYSLEKQIGGGAAAPGSARPGN